MDQFGNTFPGAQESSNVPSQDQNVEELVEAIIEEKWESLLNDLTKLAEWKNNTTNKIVALEQKFDDLRHEFDKVHSVILSKISDYDKNMSMVGSEVKAMEKVFSKVLPLFTENVAELSKITKELRGSKK